MPAFLSQLYPPKPKWNVEEIPDLTGKVVIVTGGNTGIGKETIKQLLKKNAKVYLAARSKEKAEATIKELTSETKKEAIFLHLDLGDLSAIKKAADEFKSKESSLHILFNNAGVMEPPLGQLTADGYELQFGTNALGHYYLTRLLLPILISTASSTSEGKTRIINTSSLSHTLAPPGGVVWDTVIGNEEKAMKAKKKLSGQSLYGQSKWANVVMSNEIARQYGDQGIISIALNPGNIRTELQRHASANSWLFAHVAGPLLLHPTPLGAITQLWAGTSAEALKHNGEYVWPWARYNKPARPDTNDRAKAEELMKWFDKQLEGKL